MKEIFKHVRRPFYVERGFNNGDRVEIWELLTTEQKNEVTVIRTDKYIKI